MALSPMMKHYLELKEKYKDTIIFYRLGDFYEMFFDDAKKASKLLDLTLTGRDCGLEERAPMCGIPYHAADAYIAKLVSLGEKVAICEQLSEPGAGKLVERDIIRVVTAGTIIEEDLIDAKSNNYIASVFEKCDKYSLSWSDITTGEFYVQSFTDIATLIDTLVKISPVEMIGNATAVKKINESSLIVHGVLPKVYQYSDYEYIQSTAEKTLKEHFNVLSLSAFAIENDGLIISSAGALIAYLRETQKHALINITTIRSENFDEYMKLDVNAIKNLELVSTLKDGKKYGSLLWLIDKTKTNMGARTLRNWLLSPLTNISKINYRLDGVQELYDSTLIRQGITELLDGVKDISRLAGKVSNGNLMPKDCVALYKSLEALPSLKFSLLGLNSKILKDLSEFPDMSDVVKLLKNAIEEFPPNLLKDGGFIKEGYNAELDEYRALNKNGKQVIAEIEQKERQNTGIKTLRISYNRVFGYYIEVTNSFKEHVPYTYIRKQTLANAERYITEELKEIEEKILTSEDKSIRLELKLFNEIKEVLADRITELNAVSDAIGALDVICAFSNFAKQKKYVRPVIVESDKELEIKEGRHPVVESISKEQFVVNDTLLDSSDNNMMILTGPNMAGKSTYMRQVAIITLMAHIGCFVPAKHAKIPVVDRIFTRVGASDNLIMDQSTFMVEMTEVASIIMNATKNSLIILDEIGRGTSTFDGLSIAWAVVEYLTKNVKAKTLFATHYHELTELEGKLDGVKNYKITVKEFNNSIIFLRKIMRGGANKSFGIEVASLAGVPKGVTDRAKIILKNLEKNDLSLSKINEDLSFGEEKSLSKVEMILKDLNLENITPMQAFAILTDLKEKLDV